MKEWKVRQELYHRVNTEFSDDLNNFTVELDNNIVDTAVRYFTSRDIGWVYPGKSYMVAICYALWIAETWEGDPIAHLNDPDLLHGNDPYFVPYSQDPGTYDSILARIGYWQFDQSQGLVPDVRGYFIEEFMLDE
jgi:hypothetical protein